MNGGGTAVKNGGVLQYLLDNLYGYSIITVGGPGCAKQSQEWVSAPFYTCLDVLLLGLRAETARMTLVSDQRDGEHVERA